MTVSNGDATGGTVILLSARLGPVLPAAAMPVLRTAGVVYAGQDVPEEIRQALDARSPGSPADLLAETSPVLLATTPDDPMATALCEAGATVITTPEPAGARLLDAVAVMDTLRSPGGCPWDAAQTHDSLRQYLVEETYELLEAIEDGDRKALREELGDVLLQVLFHARLAAEHPTDSFDADSVAADLVDKLVGRHPHVFAADESGAEDLDGELLDNHDRRWDELKQAEKRRESSVDGVALGQPAIALAAKLAHRAAKAGLPAELFPVGLPDGSRSVTDVFAAVNDDGTGATLFTVAALARLAGEDPEAELRRVARAFATRVRQAEQAAKQGGADPAALSADDWRRYWPVSP